MIRELVYLFSALLTVIFRGFRKNSFTFVLFKTEKLRRQKVLAF